MLKKRQITKQYVVDDFIFVYIYNVYKYMYIYFVSIYAHIK